jgi:hypothetical protein
VLEGDIAQYDHTIADLERAIKALRPQPSFTDWRY